MHPLQGASFLSTPLQGGILKPPALRVVADLRSDVVACFSTARVSFGITFPKAGHFGNVP